MPSVFLRGRTGHQKVIDVPIAEIQPAQNLIHKTLECLSCIPETERHASEFEQPKWSYHSSQVQPEFGGTPSQGQVR